MSGQVKDYLEHLARIGNAFPRYIFFPPLKDRTSKPLPNLKGYKPTDIKVHSIEEAIDLIHKNEDRMACVSSGVFTDTTKGRKNKDVVRVQDIVIDIDSQTKGSDFQTPPDVLKQLESTALKIQNRIHTLGFVDTFIKMSGNGYHIHIPVDVDIVTFTEDSYKLCVKQLYNELKEYKSDLFKFDKGATSTLNRVWKLPEQQNVKYKLQLQKDVLPNIRCSTFLDKIPHTASLETTIKTNTELFCQLKDKIQPKQKKIATNPVSRINAQLHKNDPRIKHPLTKQLFDKLLVMSESSDRSSVDFYAWNELQNIHGFDSEDELFNFYTLCCEAYNCHNFKWMTEGQRDTYKPRGKIIPAQKENVNKVVTSFSELEIPPPQRYKKQRLIHETENDLSNSNRRNKKIRDKIYCVEFAEGKKEYVVCPEGTEALQEGKDYSFIQLSKGELYDLSAFLPNDFFRSKKKPFAVYCKQPKDMGYEEYDTFRRSQWVNNYHGLVYKPDTLVTKDELLKVFGTKSINEIIMLHFNTEGRDPFIDTLLKSAVFGYSTNTSPKWVQKFTPHLFICSNTKTTKTTSAKLYSGVEVLEEASPFYLLGGGTADKNNTKIGYLHNRNRPTILDETSDWNVGKNTSKLNLKNYMRDGRVQRARGHSSDCQGTSQLIFLQNHASKHSDEKLPDVYTVYEFDRRIMNMDKATCGRFAFITLRNNLSRPNKTRVKHLDKLAYVFVGIHEHSMAVFDLLYKNERVLDWSSEAHCDEHVSTLQELRDGILNFDVLHKDLIENMLVGYQYNHEPQKGLALRNALCRYPLNVLFDTEYFSNEDNVTELLSQCDDEYSIIKKHSVEECLSLVKEHVSVERKIIQNKLETLAMWKKLLVNAYYTHFTLSCASQGYTSLEDFNKALNCTELTEMTTLRGTILGIEFFLSFQYIGKQLLTMLVDYMGIGNGKYTSISRMVSKVNQLQKTNDTSCRRNTIHDVNEEISFTGLVLADTNLYIFDRRIFNSAYKQWLRNQNTRKKRIPYIYPGNSVNSVQLVHNAYNCTANDVAKFVENTVFDIHKEETRNG